MINGDVYEHIHALQLASECVELGARIRTVALVTGLNMAMLRRLFYRSERSACGRYADTCDWYHRGCLVVRAEACVFGSICDTLVSQLECKPSDALVCAYRLYRERCTVSSRLTFDLAFTISSELHGVWTVSSPQLVFRRCRHCGRRYMAAVGEVNSDAQGCVFCRLVKKYHQDPYLRAHFQRQCSRSDVFRPEKSPR